MCAHGIFCSYVHVYILYIGGAYKNSMCAHVRALLTLHEWLHAVAITSKQENRLLVVINVLWLYVAAGSGVCYCVYLLIC